jgi:hypothetical protein
MDGVANPVQQKLMDGVANPVQQKVSSFFETFRTGLQTLSSKVQQSIFNDLWRGLQTPSSKKMNGSQAFVINPLYQATLRHHS